MARVFLSHSSRDNASAAMMKAWLDGQGFAPAFLDFDQHSGIPAGADWERTLYEQIQGSQALLILQTPNWSASRWCFAEFVQARALGKPIFQVVESDEGAAEKPIATDLQRLDLRHDRPAGLEQLRRELERIALQDQGGFPWPPPGDPGRPPFPGLMVFEAEDTPVFFGRDKDWRAVNERLNTRRVQRGPCLLVLQGASGSGKSSLLRAGVLPRLRRAGRQWLVLPVLRPRARPLESMAQTLAVALQRPEAWRELHQQLLTTTESQALASLFAGWTADLRLAANSTEAQLLLPIDQAEELFTVAEATERQRFVEVLAAVLQPPLQLQALMTIRADAMDCLQAIPELVNSLETLPLGPLSLERYREIIEGPARVAGLKADRAFVEKAILDTTTEDALPLLAFALRQLHDRYGSAGVLSLSDYQALGDPAAGLSPLENAVKQAADGVLQALRPDQSSLKALSEAFVPPMVRVSEQGNYARRAAIWESLPEAARPLLEALVAARLLVRRQKEGQPSTVEVAHEALLRVWPLLRGWIDDSRDFLIGSQQLEQDLAQWQEASPSDKPRALLTGLKLAKGRAWMAERGEQLSPELLAFIKSSQGRSARQRKIVLGGLSSGLAVVSVALLFAWGQLVQTQRQRGESLAATAKLTAASRPADALVEAIAAVGASRFGMFLPGAAPISNSITGSLIDALRQNREKNRLQVHTGRGFSVAVGPDGRRVVTGSEDGKVRLWDVTNGKAIGKPHMGHQSAVTTVEWSRDGRTIASIGNDGMVLLWDATKTESTGTPLKRQMGSVTTVAFSIDGSRLASGSEDGSVQLWDTSSGEPIGKPFKKHNHPISWISFSGDGHRIASVSESSKSYRTVLVWDVTSGEQIGKPITGPVDQPFPVAFSPDGQRIASCDGDSNLRLWDATSGEPIGKPLTVADGNYWHSALRFSPDSRKVASGGHDGTVRLWDATNGEVIGKPLKGDDDWVRSVAFSPDGRRITSTGDGVSTVRLWDATNGEPIGKPLIGHTDDIFSVVFSGDGHSIISASHDGTVRLWDATGDDPLTKTLVDPAGKGLSDAFALSGDGRRIATGGSDGTVRLWDATTGEQVGKPLKGHTGWVLSVAFTDSGRRLASYALDRKVLLWDLNAAKPMAKPLGQDAFALSGDGHLIATGGSDGTVRLWEAGNGEPFGKPLKGHAYGVSSVAFSGDGRHLVSGGYDGLVRLWDLKSRQAIGKPFKAYERSKDDPMVTMVALNRDSSRIIGAADDGTVQMWDANSGKTLWGPFTKRNIFDWRMQAAFSHDGLQMVTGDENGTVRLWDANSGKPIGKPVKGYQGLVTAVTFNGDGSRIASGFADGAIRLWDTKSGEAIGKPLEGHTRRVRSVMFGPNDRFIASTGEDGTFRLWNLQLLIAACNLIKSHSSLAFPEPGVQQEARDTCKRYAWQ